ncbi:hypothetical protein SAMN02745229_02910 [Butyrivibrio fibrisolvens DSM 3071]|uniref:O-antigen ligase like membrane protein n=1 Tax=Butyrivibrio fibrisolvens DSM 3071 TaxID=1121131 RepID=A0A1M6A836_BUTFI|nr:hypothetical protein [Butyrivibrio fibrisolvens]SHI32615.1 hypothetical protein SAMN02745229_02910 [Butyrivibrio fibrisolvens DSM 3071]
MSNVKTITNQTSDDNKVTAAQYCYLLYFAVMFFAKAIGLYDGQLLYNISIVVGMTLFGLKVLMSRHSIFELCWMSVLLICGFMVVLNTDQRGFLFYMTLVAGIKDVPEKKVFKTALLILGFAYPVMAFLTLSGIVSEYYRLHHKIGMYIICHGLGYPHPNVTHITYLILTMLILYFVRNRSAVQMLKISIFLMLGNVIVFGYTFSFTGAIAVTVYLIINFCLTSIPKARKLWGVLSQMVLPICLAFALIGPLVIKGHLFDIINKALNTRFYLSKYFLTMQPATFFGMRFLPEELENYNYTMDCSYVYGLRQLGVIPFVILILFLLYTIYSLNKKGRNVELAIMLGICVAGVTEPFMFNSSYRNMAFVLIGMQIFELSDKISKKLPSFWNKEIHIIKAGDIVVNSNALLVDRVAGYCEDIIKRITESKVRFGILFAIMCIASIIGYYVAVQHPTTMYVNYDINEEADWPETMLTLEDVAELEEKGEIILDYTGEGTPMYAYDGLTPIIEYNRRALAVGLYTGALGVVLVSLGTARFRSKRK